MKKLFILLFIALGACSPKADAAEKSIMLHGGYGAANLIIDNTGENVDNFLFGGTALIGNETFKGGFRFLHGEYEGKISKLIKVKAAVPPTPYDDGVLYKKVGDNRHEVSIKKNKVYLDGVEIHTFTLKEASDLLCGKSVVVLDKELCEYELYSGTLYTDTGSPAEYANVSKKATVEFNRYTVIAQKMLDDNIYVIADAGVNNLIINNKAGSGFTAGLGLGIKKHLKNSPIFVGAEGFATYNADVKVKDVEVKLGPTTNVLANIGIDF